MLHLSNISINPDYIVYIKWITVTNQYGDRIEPSIAVYIDLPHNLSGDDVTILYFPEDSPNAKLLKRWRDKQLTLAEQVERRELEIN